MKNGTERFLRFARKTALVCFSVFGILFFIANVFFTVRQYNTGDFYKADYQVISLQNILVTLLLLAALYILHRKKIGNSKILLAVFLTVSLLIGYMSVLLLLTWTGTSGVVRYWEERSGNSYDNRLPKIAWIAYGLNYEMYHPGSYTPEIEDYYKEEGWSAEAAQLYAEDFIERVLDDFRREPSKALTFCSRKFRVAFANPEYEAFAQYRELTVTETNQIIISGWMNDLCNEIWDGTSSLIVLGVLAFLVGYRKKDDLDVLLPAVIVFGGFLFHAFWEVKAIYLYQYHLFLLPYAAYGLSCLFRSIRKTKMIEY